MEWRQLEMQTDQNQMFFSWEKLTLTILVTFWQ